MKLLKKYPLRKKNLFPLNPGQPHCSDTKNIPIIQVSPFLTIFIEKKLFQNTAKRFYGEKNIYFENKSHEINAMFLNLLNIFIEESINHQTDHKFIMENLNLQIIICLLRLVNNNYNNDFAKKNQHNKRSIKTVIEYIHDNYKQDLSLDEIAGIVNYSPFHFIRIFKAETGKTPIEYLIDIKINKAKKLLVNSKLTVTDICFSCGFNNRNHFCAIFKRKTGYSPSQYRKISQ